MKIAITEHSNGQLSLTTGNLVINHAGDEVVKTSMFEIQEVIIEDYLKNPSKYALDLQKGVIQNAESS